MLCNYNALDSLNLNDTYHFDKVNICCYNIILSGVKPILSYLLSKQPNDCYDFPVLYNNLFLLENIKLHFSFNSNQKIVLKGLKKYKNQLYAFYELIENTCRTNEKDYKKSQIYEKCLIHEILNIKKIKEFNISSNVIDFFSNNPNFCYLHDKNNQIIEIPIIGFKNINVSHFNYVLYNEILLEPNDDYYKLSLVYNNENKCVVIRYAVFLNKYFSILNIQKNNIYEYFKIYDSIIISKSNEILFKNKSHQLFL